METIRLNVPGITCDGWVTTVRMAVGRLGGIGNVSGDAKARTITMEYNPSEVTVEAIRQALDTVGYDSTVVAWALRAEGLPVESPSLRKKETALIGTSGPSNNVLGVLGILLFCLRLDEESPPN